MNFSAVWSSCFHSLESRFFALEYRKRHSPGLYCFKKKVEKMAIFEPKLWVNPFRKMSIFSIFWTSCFYSLERRFFVLEYSKRHFPGLHCLKKKVGKMAIFGPIPWVNPLWKNVNFSIFWTFCFYSLERRFFVLEYRKRHFPCLYCLKNKCCKNGHFWKNFNFSIFWTPCF